MGLARASASAVPSAVTSVKDTPLPSAAPTLVQAPVSSQVRCYHAGNMDVPDFTYYRRSAVKDPTAKSSETAEDRMAFGYVMAGGFALGGAYGAKSLVNQSSAPGLPHRMCWLWPRLRSS